MRAQAGGGDPGVPCGAFTSLTSRLQEMLGSCSIFPRRAGAHARHTEAEAALEELREIKTQLEVENASLRRRGLDLGDADERHKAPRKV